MTPRAYSMEKRATATAETRRRILEASLMLHSQKGMLATTWDDIARAAGVAVGTVYYHFPSFDELIPACSGFGRQLNPLPTSQIFLGVRGTKQRVERLVRALAEFYRKAQGPLFFTFAERVAVPAVDRLANELMASVHSVVQEALGPDAPPKAVAAADALLDFRVWDAMRERGLDQEVIIEEITAAIHRLAARRTQVRGSNR
jgi:AcrR family transcriptional regulator